MTKDCASANSETRPVPAVSTWENQEANGLALCGARVFEDHIDMVQSLRERQAAHQDSLPSDPIEVIRAARQIMQPDGDQYPEGFEDALHLSFALDALVQEGDLDTQGRKRDAALYIADRVATAMHRTARQLDLVSSILTNPKREG